MHVKKINSWSYYHNTFTQVFLAELCIKNSFVWWTDLKFISFYYFTDYTSITKHKMMFTPRSYWSNFQNASFTAFVVMWENILVETWTASRHPIWFLYVKATREDELILKLFVLNTVGLLVRINASYWNRSLPWIYAPPAKQRPNHRCWLTII